MTTRNNEDGANGSQSGVSIQNLLRRKLRLASIGMLVPAMLATLVAMGVYSGRSHDVEFDRAFTTLQVAARRTMVSLEAATEPSAGGYDSLAAAGDAFHELLRAYSAIGYVASEPDGGRSSVADGPEASALAIAASLGISPGDAAEAYRLRSAKLPPSLEAIWNDGVRRTAADLIVRLAPLIETEERSLKWRRATWQTLRRIDDLDLIETTARADAAFAARSEKSAELGMIMFGGLLLLLLAAVIGKQIVIYRPLLRRISEMERDIVSARAAALESDQAKSEFLASMSHEIRTPMNGVMGMAELLAETELDDRQSMFLQVIRTSASSLLGIINDILDYSKIDAGRLFLHAEPFETAQLAEEPARLVSEAAARKGVELCVRVAPDVEPWLVGDFPRLRQIVTNLVGNAVKFTDAGEVAIDVSTAPRGDHGVWLRLEVRDTGIGVPKGKLEAIFDKFSQANQSASRDHEGTGLGLAIVKGLTSAMKGEITVDSELGRGSTFRVSIPLARDTRAAPSSSRRLQGAKVLVIDDNETNRFIAQEMLDAWGCENAGAATGREGLRRLDAAARAGKPFDVVLLDHHMPQMDGEEVLRRIRAAEPYSDVSVVLLTSIADDASIAACREVGLEGCAIKPVMSDALQKTLRDALPMAPANPSVDASQAQVDREPDAVDAAASSDAQLSLSGRAPVPSHPDPGAEIRRPDILLAEDNEVNRLLAEQVISGLGLTFVVAVNGAEAVERFLKERPRAILMDVSMPEMDGLEATRKIRALEAARDAGAPAPIIGLTAHALDGAREACLDAGMDGYLSKPISPKTLRETLLGLDRDDGASKGRRRSIDAA